MQGQWGANDTKSWAFRETDINVFNPVISCWKLILNAILTQMSHEVFRYIGSLKSGNYFQSRFMILLKVVGRVWVLCTPTAMSNAQTIVICLIFKQVPAVSQTLGHALKVITRVQRDVWKPGFEQGLDTAYHRSTSS